MPADEKAVLRAVYLDSVTSGFNSPRWAGVAEGIPGTPDGKVGRCAPGELRSWQPGKTGLICRIRADSDPPSGDMRGGGRGGILRAFLHRRPAGSIPAPRFAPFPTPFGGIGL